jgi:hypothetical protein
MAGMKPCSSICVVSSVRTVAMAPVNILRKTSIQSRLRSAPPMYSCTLLFESSSWSIFALSSAHLPVRGLRHQLQQHLCAISTPYKLFARCGRARQQVHVLEHGALPVRLTEFLHTTTLNRYRIYTSDDATCAWQQHHSWRRN